MITVLRRRAKSLVGLDVGTSAVKAVEIRQTGGEYGVIALGTEPLPPRTIVDGAIADRGRVTDAVRAVLSDHAITTKEVAVSIAGNAVIVKRISLPAMSPEELSASIYWEAKQHIPFDVEDVNLDYQVLGSTPDEAASGSQDVLLVAAKKDRIADYTEVIR